MIVWKDEGERCIAYIGEARCGSVGKRRWQSVPPLPLEDLPFDWQSFDRGPCAAGNLEAAKSALEAAVADWVERAGLVSAEPSEEIRLRIHDILRGLFLDAIGGGDADYDKRIDEIVAALTAPLKG